MPCTERGSAVSQKNSAIQYLLVRLEGSTVRSEATFETWDAVASRDVETANRSGTHPPDA